MKPVHIVVLLVVVLLLFGARRLPDLAKSVGQSLKIFKNEVKDLTDEKPAPVVPPAALPSAATQQAVPVEPQEPTTPGLVTSHEPHIPHATGSDASTPAGDAPGSH